MNSYLIIFIYLYNKMTKTNPIFVSGTITNKSKNYIQQLLKLKEYLESDDEMVNYVTTTSCDKKTREYGPKIARVLHTFRHLPGTDILNSDEELEEMLKDGLMVVNLHKANTMTNYLFYLYDMMAHGLITKEEIIHIVRNWVETCPRTKKRLGHFFKKSYAKAVVDDFKKAYLRIKNLEKLYEAIHRIKQSGKIKSLKSQSGGAGLLDKMVKGVMGDGINKVKGQITDLVQKHTPEGVKASGFNVAEFMKNNKENPAVNMANQITGFLELPGQIVSKMVRDNMAKTSEAFIEFLSTFDSKLKDTSKWDLIFFPLWTLERWFPNTVQVFDMFGNKLDEMDGLAKVFSFIPGKLVPLFGKGLSNISSLIMKSVGMIPFVGIVTNALSIGSNLLGIDVADPFIKAGEAGEWLVNNWMDFINIIFNMSRKRWARVLRYVAASTGPDGAENMNKLYTKFSKMTDGAKKLNQWSEKLTETINNPGAMKALLDGIAEAHNVPSVTDS